MNLSTRFAYLLFIFFVPTIAFASNASETSHLDLTDNIIGYLALGVFAIAYLLVIFEEQLHLPKEEAIESKMVSRSIESAQEKIEGFHFDSRNQVLAYDDVLNRQRKTVYARRRRLLMGSHEEIDAVLDEVIARTPDLQTAIEAKRKEFGEERL